MILKGSWKVHRGRWRSFEYEYWQGWRVCEGFSDKILSWCSWEGGGLVKRCFVPSSGVGRGLVNISLG